MALRQITANCAISQLAGVQALGVVEIDTELPDGTSESYYELSIVFYRKDVDGRDYISSMLLPIVDEPGEVFSQAASLAGQLNLLKLSPWCYCNPHLAPLVVNVEEYCGDHPLRSEKHLIVVTFTNGVKQWLGSYPNREEASADFARIMKQWPWEVKDESQSHNPTVSVALPPKQQNAISDD